MRRVRAALVLGAGALAASLLLARVHPFGDEGLYGVHPEDAPVLDHSRVPDAVRAVLVEKCADCHSDRPRVPFYGRLAPASWLMERDIVSAREAMNLSAWDGYSAAQQQTLAAKMVQQTKAREMPPLQYRMIHWNALITDADAKSLGQWAHGAQSEDAGSGNVGEGDAARGKMLFEKRCTGCHSLTQNKEGPRLQGVYGRTAGTVPGFAYSVAVKKAAVVWDDASLEKWLTDPDAFVAGNDMDFLVAKLQERRDLIRYLREESGK
jgi:cytochrome c